MNDKIGVREAIKKGSQKSRETTEYYKSFCVKNADFAKGYVKWANSGKAPKGMKKIYEGTRKLEK